MSKPTVTHFFKASWLAAVVLAGPALGICATPTGNIGDPPSTVPQLDLTTALQAIGPHSSLGGQTKVFDRLVGTWDVEYVDFSKDGKVTRRTGQFIVGWVLDGRAIQDVWIVDPSGERKDREVYSDMHYFDAKSGRWLSVFIDPEHASSARFTGDAAGADRIVLDTRDFAGGDTRWSFSDIKPDTLVYRDEASADGGKTWRLRSEYHMKRHGATVARMEAAP